MNIYGLCIVEYSDHLTTFYHVCCSPLRATIHPPTNDYHLYHVFATYSIWFHFIVCLHAVPVSQSRKEKHSKQYEVLWKSVSILCCDYCNHWTHCHTACPVWTNAASANWNWSKGNSSVIAPIISTVCTGMVCEEKISEQIQDWLGWEDVAVNSWGTFFLYDWNHQQWRFIASTFVMLFIELKLDIAFLLVIC